MKFDAYMKTLSSRQKLALAAKLNTSIGMLYQVAGGFKRTSVGAGGTTVPYCKASGWRVTPHCLRPDVYPYPTDCLSARVIAMRAAR